MAGHKNRNVEMDPAILRWANMHANRYKYFRWTPRTVRLTFIYVAVVPSIFAYMAYKTDADFWAQGKWDFRGKLRGDDIREF